MQAKQEHLKEDQLVFFLVNIYLHYVLDLWFEKSIKPKLRGESYLIRYIDDFVVCFQHKEDAIKFQRGSCKTSCKVHLRTGAEQNKIS